MKKTLIGATLFAALCSVHASAVPVMIVQLESSSQGIKVLSQEVRDIEYKKSRLDEKAQNAGQFRKARSGGWVAQIVRSDGTVESEQAIEDPRQLHGEFFYEGAKNNERTDVQIESGVFSIQIPVTTETVTLRIVERQSRALPPSLNAANKKTLNKPSVNGANEDAVKGEFKLGGQSK